MKDKTAENAAADSKKCGNVMDCFFSLDKGERLPFSSSMHLFFCKSCRTKVRLLTRAEKLASKPLLKKCSLKYGELPEKIRSADSSLLKNLKPVSMRRWVLSGAVMTVLLVLSGIFLEKTQNVSYLTWFYAVVGGAVTVYCSAFIAVNMDFFIKITDTKNLSA